MICEDWWFPAVAETLAESGAEILLSINGSPYEVDKHEHASRWPWSGWSKPACPSSSVNQICGQDELVFEGASFVLNADRSLAVQMPHFEEAVTLTEWTRQGETLVCAPQPLSPEPERLDSIYRAMVLGLRDYVRKNGFPGVILGLSGGIDSALSAAVAVDALGPERCARSCCRPLHQPRQPGGRRRMRRPAGHPPATPSPSNRRWRPSARAGPDLRRRQADITEENIQSRARGLILMAISNKLGHMVLTTGNKSRCRSATPRSTATCAAAIRC
jgi:NAD+ synthase